MAYIKTFIPLVLVWAISLPVYAAPTLTLTYAGDSAKPVAGVKLTQTESDGTVTIYASNSNGEATLNTTANTYTLAASLTETGDDPVDLLDAIWILQHSGELRTLTPDQQKAADVNGDGEVDLLDAIYILQHSGELRTLTPNLVFLDANTGNPLSETTFNPGDTPSVTVIRTGDVDQGFDPTLITDHAPILTGTTTLSIDENETSVATLTATDIEGDALTYSLSGTDASSFSISSSGVITFNSTPNCDDFSYSITVNVTDGTNNASEDLTINKYNVSAVCPSSTVYIDETKSYLRETSSGEISGSYTIDDDKLRIACKSGQQGVNGQEECYPERYSDNNLGYNWIRGNKDLFTGHFYDLHEKETETLGRNGGLVISEDTLIENKIVKIISDIEFADGVTLTLKNAGIYSDKLNPYKISGFETPDGGKLICYQSKIRNVNMFRVYNSDIQECSLIGISNPYFDYNSIIKNNYFQRGSSITLGGDTEFTGNIVLSLRVLSELSEIGKINHNIFAGDLQCSDRSTDWALLRINSIRSARQFPYAPGTQVNLKGNIYLGHCNALIAHVGDKTVISEGEYFGVSNLDDIKDYRTKDPTYPGGNSTITFESPIFNVENISEYNIYQPLINWQGAYKYWPYKGPFYFDMPIDYEAGMRELNYTIPIFNGRCYTENLPCLYANPDSTLLNSGKEDLKMIINNTTD